MTRERIGEAAAEHLADVHSVAAGDHAAPEYLRLLCRAALDAQRAWEEWPS